MKYAIDASVLVDHLRNYPPAIDLLKRLVIDDAQFVSSFVIRLEILTGMRPGEEVATYKLLSVIEWEPVAEPECNAAGALGRQYLPANSGIDTADLLLAEVARRHGAELLTMNVKHFQEMFPGLSAPYA